MPLEVVVELQIRAISCPGVFLPSKQYVYLGVYILNQYLETDYFSPVFPIPIHQCMRFEKIFEKAIDPGTVVENLESFLARFELIQQASPAWEELAYYEENTRDFLFPEPKLTSSPSGLQREVLMRTAVGFPGIAPKLEFCTRTAIRGCVFLDRNRFFEQRYKSQIPLSSYGPKFPLSKKKTKRNSNLDTLLDYTQSRTPSPFSTRRFFQDRPPHFKGPKESKPPFVVRHVDSTKPFGESTSEHHSQKSRMKPGSSNLPFPVRRASSLDDLTAKVKVIKEPDERIILRSDSPSPLESSKFGKLMPSYNDQGDADFYRETSFAASQHSKSPSPLLDQSLRERFLPSSESTWKKIHERVCSLLTSHRAETHLNEKDSVSEINDILEKPSYPLKKNQLNEEKNIFKLFSDEKPNKARGAW
ncbi:spermatogenesis associated 6-like protein isoform X1 [Sorex araneus]|uniref:spermatogenesis associated 6-like protein isoform X1 n=3 Tax=Sorex araneus TaxID=42254 RepID=UPI00243387CB|nr:spermatogenesis associated 6-like protein isoform X1 [Sorex araneus]